MCKYTKINNKNKFGYKKKNDYICDVRLGLISKSRGIEILDLGTLLYPYFVYM